MHWDEGFQQLVQRGQPCRRCEFGLHIQFLPNRAIASFSTAHDGDDAKPDVSAMQNATEGSVALHTTIFGNQTGCKTPCTPMQNTIFNPLISAKGFF